jgi:phage terminase large subunit-like protein
VALNRFTRYHCNRKVSSIEKAFDLQKWNACAGTLSDWNEADAIGCATDLGARDDLAAIGWCARFIIDEREGKPVYRFEVKADVFIAEDSKRDLTKQPFFQWIYDDLLKKSRFPIADLRDKIVETSELNGCRLVAYDPYNGQMIAEELKQAGLEPFRMAQTHAMFNEPIRDLLAAIDEKRLIHDGNELLTWAINNCVLYQDRKDNWMYDKSHSAEKIDPAVAITMAFRVACVAPARYSGKFFIN